MMTFDDRYFIDKTKDVIPLLLAVDEVNGLHLITDDALQMLFEKAERDMVFAIERFEAVKTILDKRNGR